MTSPAELELDLVLKEESRRKLQSHFPSFFREAWKVLEPFTPLNDCRYIDAICEHLQAVRDGQIKRLIINQPPRTGKALALDTPIPTPQGIKPMAKIRPGDHVLGTNGLPVRVLFESEIRLAECFEIEFSTGGESDL